MSRSLPRACQSIFHPEMALQRSNGGPFSGMRVLGKRSVFDPVGKGGRGVKGWRGCGRRRCRGLGALERDAQ